jgi:hypoxanthine-guanine phosphoribosyltransferase
VLAPPRSPRTEIAPPRPPTPVSRVCAFLAKQRERRAEVRLDYVGPEIPDMFVVGYGLDRDERHRNLPYVARLD